MRPSRNVTNMGEQEAVNLVLARLLDYFGRRTDWQRRLWNPGTVTVLQETLEAVDLLGSGHLRAATVEDLLATAKRRAALGSRRGSARSPVGSGGCARRPEEQARRRCVSTPARAAARRHRSELLGALERQRASSNSGMAGSATRGWGSSDIQAMPCASAVGNMLKHADGGKGAPASSCGISTTAPSGPNCQPWYGHTSRPPATAPFES